MSFESFVSPQKNCRRTSGKKMGRKSKDKLKKAVTLAQPRAEKVHDRRATDIIINARVAARVVDDPLELGAQISVIVSLRDDPLMSLRSCHAIDDAQLNAGREWQRLFDLCEGGAMRSGLTEFVDGRRSDGGGIDARMDAYVSMLNCKEALGDEGHALMRRFLGHRCTIADIAAERGYTSKFKIKCLGVRVRECLNTVAIEFGFAEK
jgi:hypothetical protein